MRNLLDNAIRAHESALNVQAQRQQLLASNIANADTPNYKARDLDFRAALGSAIQGRLQPLALANTSRGHLPLNGANGGPFDSFVGYRQEHQSAVDGNTVDMDVERAAFAQSSIHYEASVTFINGLLSGMRRAISGQ